MNNKAKSIKKSLIVLVLILVATTSFAASGETLNIGGSVPLVMDITVSTTGNEILLELSDVLATVSDLQIATIDIESNAMAGWDLVISSANGGKLLNPEDQEITYSLAYTATAGSATPVVVAAPTVDGDSYASNVDQADNTGTLGITYDKDPDYPAGYYSDQLTLVLRAK